MAAKEIECAESGGRERERERRERYREREKEREREREMKMMEMEEKVEPSEKERDRVRPWSKCEGQRLSVGPRQSVCGDERVSECASNCEHAVDCVNVSECMCVGMFVSAVKVC